MSVNWKDACMEDMVVVITGASSGLGKASAQFLAGRAAKVYMLGRNRRKLEAAAQDVLLASKASPTKVTTMIVDLASLQSVRDFVKAFQLKESRIDVLMNNAGIMMTPQDTTVDGFELQFGTNVLGHFLLTHLLMDQIVAGAPGSRIINLSSMGHTLGKKDIQWDNLMFEHDYTPMNAYAQSKLANILFNLELSKRLKDAGVTCYAVHPGAVDTNLGAHLTGCWGCILGFWRCCLPCAYSTPDQGAQTQVRCAMDPLYAKETGYYYADCKRKSPSTQAQNKESAAQLWDICVQLVKLQPEEIHQLLK